MTPKAPSRSVLIGYALANLLVAVAVAFGIFQIVNTAAGVARNGDMAVGSTLPVKLQLSPQRLRLPDGIRRDDWATTTVQVEHPTGTQEALAGAMDVTQIALFVAVLWLLRGIARSVKEGDPFGAANVRRLRGLGGLLVLGAPIVEVIETSLRTALFDRLAAAQSAGLGSAGYTIPGGFVVAGLGAFILAEVFAHGVRLREDVEATI